MEVKEEVKKVNKKRNVLLIVITILSVILISTGGILSLTTYDNKETNNDNDNSNEDKSQSNKVERINIDSITAQTIINRLKPLDDYAFTYVYDTNENYGVMYKQNSLLAKDLPVAVKTYLVATNIDLANDATLDESTGVNCIYKVTNQKFKENYQLMFGKNTNYEITNYDFTLPTVQISNEEITINNCGGDSNGLGYYIYKQFVKAEQTNEELYLYESIAIADKTLQTNSTSYKFYNDTNHKNIIGENIPEEDLFTPENLKKLSQYKYTFKLEDGNYYFYSVEKVK